MKIVLSEDKNAKNRNYDYRPFYGQRAILRKPSEFVGLVLKELKTFFGYGNFFCPFMF